MNWTWKPLAVALVAAAFLYLDLHARSKATAELNLGVEAFNQSKYAQAIEHLEKAVSLEPENQDARMYLANAYVKQHPPGIHTQENIHLAERAIAQYQQVLDSNSNRTVKIESAKGVADMYLQVKKFDDSKKYYQMASDFDPKDPEPYVAIGGIDFDECTRRDTEEGAKLGLKPGEHPNPKSCERIAK